MLILIKYKLTAWPFLKIYVVLSNPPYYASVE